MMLSGGSAVLASSLGELPAICPSASVSQYQLVLGEKVVPGSANLAAPTGCVSKIFNARVRGKQVAKVVFKLDGKTIKTLTKPNSGANFQVHINPAKFKIGVHRITATVITQNFTIDQDTNQVTQGQPEAEDLPHQFPALREEARGAAVHRLSQAPRANSLRPRSTLSGGASSVPGRSIQQPVAPPPSA